MNPFSFLRSQPTPRPIRFRPGSVLLIVIVLLLILGMIGVAFVSTTRTTRVASAQNVMNADLDVMIDGITKICEGTIIADLNDNQGNLLGINPGPTQNIHGVYQGTYDPKQTYNVGDIVSYPAPAAKPPFTPPSFFVATANNSSSAPALGSTSPWLQTTHIPGVTSSLTQPWLAERIPTPAGYTPTPPTLAYWPNISQIPVPIGSTVATSVLGTPFESPDEAPAPSLTPGTILTGQISTSSTPGSLVPGFKLLNNGTSVPTLNFTTPSGSGAMIAGDADGDGIADSLLFRIPGASYDGLTWYAAVRIIDNNSAINLNTALSRDNEYTISNGSITPAKYPNYYSLFPTGVGLAELLHPSDNFNNFNAYRSGAGATNNPQADAAPGQANPLSPVTRSDFQFLDAGDLLYQQLIRRISNPGFNGSAANGPRCQPLPLSDEAALAYHFCLVNPQTASSQLSSCLAENLLPFSLMSWTPAGTSPQYYRSTPFGTGATPSADDVNEWFSDNFDYDSTTTPDYGTEPQPLRPLLVTRNPVSNAIDPVYDANAPDVGEPLDPLGSSYNPYKPPSANIIPDMMLPYGSGPQNYVHFKGKWNPDQQYQFNDIVIGNDGHTYIYVVTPTATPPSGIQLVAPTLQNLLPQAYPNGLGLYQYWQFQPWTKATAKANANTATFRELYRAFWSVMAGNPSNQNPFGATTSLNPYWPDPSGSTNPQHQFRSPLRDPTYTSSTTSTNATYLDPENTMLLRAALAAVNTMGLRDNSQNVISRTVFLNAIIQGKTQPVMARVYSNAPQPVISEVYANTYTGSDPGNPSITNEQGYVAVELYNPYSVPLVLYNWQLGLINRSPSASGYPNLTFVKNTSDGPLISAIAPPGNQYQAQNDPRPDSTGSYNNQQPPARFIILPAQGYALLENYNPNPNARLGNGDAAGRPASAGFICNGTAVSTGIWYGPGGQNHQNTCDVYVPGLQLVIQNAVGATLTRPANSPGGELVLLRPRRSDGNFTQSSDPLNTFNEGIPGSSPNLYDLVPVDSFDFTGLNLQTPQVWSYLRPKGTPATNFKQFYPGRYFSTAAPAPREGRTTTDIGTDVQSMPNPNLTWSANCAPQFGTPVTTASFANNFPPIQIYNTYSTATGSNAVVNHWPNPTLYPDVPSSTITQTTINSSSTPAFPYGAFARNGDLLDVPFIGAYRISLASAGNPPTTGNSTWGFVELNSVPRDCSFADATYTDTADQNSENIGRFCPVSARAVPPGTVDYYAWTRNLFTYLTVQSPSDAALPNFDPNINDPTTINPDVQPNPLPAPFWAYKYPPPSVNPSVPAPSLVLTADPTASDQTDQGSVGVDGLVNINTASWKVLSMLPMMTKSEDPTNNGPDNESLAKAIVSWRINHGPFTSIYDLNSVIDYNSSSKGPNKPLGFQNAEGWLNLTPNTSPHLGSLNGLLTPPDPAFPGVTKTGSTPIGVQSNLADDYQSDFALLSRVSNLITTRSDTFTVYIEIQGWQNAGTEDARPILTRRYAFIADRSAINGDPTSRFLKTLTVPND